MQGRRRDQQTTGGGVEPHETVKEHIVVGRAVRAGIRKPCGWALPHVRRHAPDPPTREVQRADDELEPVTMRARCGRLDAQEEPLVSRLQGKSPDIGHDGFAIHEFLERRAHVGTARNEVFESLKPCESIVSCGRQPERRIATFFSRRVVEPSNRRMGNSRFLIVVEGTRNICDGQHGIQLDAFVAQGCAEGIEQPHACLF